MPEPKIVYDEQNSHVTMTHVHVHNSKSTQDEAGEAVKL